MARVKARVQVHLPYDVNGTTASPGQIIEVETDHPQVIGYLEGGLLVALDPLEFPGDLQPPAQVSDEDAAATVAANEADGEPQEAEAGTETDASADPDASATDRESDAEPRETPSTRSSRAKK